MKKTTRILAMLLMAAMMLSAASEWGKGAAKLSDWTFEHYNEIKTSADEISGVTICEYAVISPFLFSPTLDWEASDDDVLAIEIKSGKLGNGQLHYRPARNPAFKDELRHSFGTPGGDGEWHMMFIPLKHGEWKGKIAQLRLAFLYEDGVPISVRRIKLMRKHNQKQTEGSLIQNGDLETPGHDGMPWNWQAKNNGTTASTLNTGDNTVLTISGNGSAELTTKPFYLDFLEKDTAGITPSLQASGKGKITAVVKMQDALYHDLATRESTREFDSKDLQTITFDEMPMSIKTARCVLTLKCESADGQTISLDNICARQKVGHPEEPWGGEWIRPGDKPDIPPRKMFFRKQFEVQDTAANAWLALNSDDAIHCVAVNGTILPQAKNALVYNVADLIRIDEYLKPGKNTVAIQAYNMNLLGGMIADVEIIGANGKQVIGTDATWLSSSDEQKGWTEPSFDDSSWSKPVCMGVGGTTPFGTLARPKIYDRGSIVLHDFKVTPCKGTPFSFDYSVEYTAVPASGDDSIPLGIYLFSKELPPNGFRLSEIELKAGKNTATGNIAYRDFLPFGNITVRANTIGVTKAPLEANLTVPEFQRPDFKAALDIDSNGTPYMKWGDKELGVIHHWCGDSGKLTDEFMAGCREADLPYYVGNHYRTWGWRPNGKFDFTELDNYIYELLEADPNARFNMQIAVDNYHSQDLNVWLEAHPSECAMKEDGTTRMNQIHGGKNVKVVSHASKLWREELHSSLMALADHLRKSPFGHRSVCLQPISGMGGEWVMWGTFSTGSGIERLDYSRPFRLYFIDFVMKKYGSLEAVNKAWGTEYADADEIRLPSTQERDRNDWFEFLDASKSKRIIDFRQSVSELIADDVITMCDAIKAGSGEQMFAGSFYGYTTYVTDALPTRSEGGHFALGKVLNSGRVDYLTHLLRYADRRAGEPAGFMTPESSLQLHGIVPFVQADIRTHRLDAAYTFESVYGRLNNLQEAIAVIQRDFSNCVVNGVGYEFGYYGQGWIAGDRRMMDAVRRCREIETFVRGKGINHYDTENSIAVIVDDISTYYSAQTSDIHNLSHKYLMPEFYHSGVGFDMYLLEDLDKMPEYKCYMFLNAYHMTPAEMDYIEKHLKGGNKVLYFTFATACAADDKIHPEYVEKVTGIKMALEPKTIKSKIKYTKDAESASPHFIANKNFGTGAKIGPFFVPQEGTVLATLQEEAKPALVAKKFQDHTVCYSSTPGFSADMIRYMADFSGINIFNDNLTDCTYASDKLFAIHTAAGGKRSFRVPAKYTKATELFSGQEYSVKDGAFDAYLEPISTVLYILE